jgi:hypothetical protein
MKRITKITLFAVGLAVLVSLVGVVPGLRPLAELQASARAATDDADDVLTFDAAADCRTFAGGLNRGDAIIINGKIFPAGTLPSGTVTFDPTQPVNGVAPIGEWVNRGQNGFPFPPAIAPSYSSAPASFGTDYFILNDGRALTTEGYLLPSGVVLSSVTGGIGSFKGAAGFSQGTILGTNATGCPNARVKFHLQPSSERQ